MRGPSLQARTIRRRLTLALAAAAGMSLVVIVSAWRHQSELGAPAVWPWLLTGIQVLSLWSAGRRYWWGWVVGGSVQLPWIAYALMTGQLGFVPGCLVSGSVQLYSFVRSPAPAQPLEATA